MAKNMKKPETTAEVEYQLFDAEAKIKYSLARFGDHLAKKNKYRSDLQGIEAVMFHLMQKHHWTPSILRDMSIDDMRFALQEEMHGWSMPADVVPKD